MALAALKRSHEMIPSPCVQIATLVAIVLQLFSLIVQKLANRKRF
jgi:hypothetical protein